MTSAMICYTAKVADTLLSCRTFRHLYVSGCFFRSGSACPSASGAPHRLAVRSEGLENSLGETVVTVAWFSLHRGDSWLRDGSTALPVTPAGGGEGSAHGRQLRLFTGTGDTPGLLLWPRAVIGSSEGGG